MIRNALLFGLSILDDLLYVVGGVCIVVGVNMISVPAAWITAGVLLIVGGIVVARDISAEESTDVLA